MNTDEPQPISLADAQRIWNLQKQKLPLSSEDKALLAQAAEWQMWKSHGIRLKPSNSSADDNSKPSKPPQKAAVAC